MSRPTREQIDRSRAIAQSVVNADCVAVVSPSDIKGALRILLAATAEPTDDELDHEAGRVSHYLTGTDRLIDRDYMLSSDGQVFRKVASVRGAYAIAKPTTSTMVPVDRVHDAIQLAYRAGVRREVQR